MKLFDKIVKHSRACGIGESLAYANGVPMEHLGRVHGALLSCPLAYLWRTFGVSMTYLSSIHGAPLVCPWRTERTFKRGNCDDRYWQKPSITELFIK